MSPIIDHGGISWSGYPHEEMCRASHLDMLNTNFRSRANIVGQSPILPYYGTGSGTIVGKDSNGKHSRDISKEVIDAMAEALLPLRNDPKWCTYTGAALSTISSVPGDTEVLAGAIPNMDQKVKSIQQYLSQLRRTYAPSGSGLYTWEIRDYADIVGSLEWDLVPVTYLYNWDMLGELYWVKGYAWGQDLGSVVNQRNPLYTYNYMPLTDEFDEWSEYWKQFSVIRRQYAEAGVRWANGKPTRYRTSPGYGLYDLWAQDRCHWVSYQTKSYAKSRLLAERSGSIIPSIIIACTTNPLEITVPPNGPWSVRVWMGWIGVDEYNTGPPYSANNICDHTLSLAYNVVPSGFVNVPELGPHFYKLELPAVTFAGDAATRYLSSGLEITLNSSSPEDWFVETDFMNTDGTLKIPPVISWPYGSTPPSAAYRLRQDFLCMADFGFDIV